MMQLNSDFSQHTIVTPNNYQWVCSPRSGVKRMMFDRIGNEQARATSLVRYEPGSIFPMHNHPGGEEILVLSGIFTEYNTDYSAGWYLRSPDGSSHQPSSKVGTTIFVKLRQMTAEENQYVRIDTNDPKNWHYYAQGEVCPLYKSVRECVVLLKVKAGERLFCSPLNGGAEILLLEGELTDPFGRYEKGSWLRLPPGDMPSLIASASGAKLYLKTGHLSPATLTGAIP
ncbi:MULTISPECIES: cupin domain-containing protein [Enterobacteriaceae]|uniref:cupin domain-containing protein n=1 Tax=Enterobacteriaceae TaxID=543 RepID=UPI000E3EAADB|nr:MULTISPECIES: cupin domain-containing protein [Enterobacteriaceae]MDM2746511.1 cupin domain-containing protein [Citrobacter sp. Cu231]